MHCRGGDKGTSSNSDGGGIDNNQQSTKSGSNNGNRNGNNDSNNNDNDEMEGRGGSGGGGHAALWREPPRKVPYKCTFVAPDLGQMLDVWESQTSESALRWWTRYTTPRHILDFTLEVILEHVLRIKIMTSLILDHAARAYLYLGISTG